MLFNHNLSFQGLSIRETKGMFLKLAGLRNNNYLQNCYLRWYLISKETQLSMVHLQPQLWKRRTLILMCIFKNSPQVKIIYLGDTDMIIPCQTAFVRNETNRICVIVWVLIVNINICPEMKSPSCCNNIQAAGLVVCVLCSLHTVAGFMMNNIGLIRLNRREGWRGQMVTETVSPQL